MPTLARRKVVSFTYPLFRTDNRIFIKNPNNAFNYVAYIEPFYYTTWIAIGAFCILTPLLLYLAAE